jgi:hypothetical protein
MQIRNGLLSLLLIGCNAPPSPDGLDMMLDSAQPATLSSLSISPPVPIVPLEATQQLTATGTFSDGTVADLTNRVMWLSGDTAVASIDSHGVVTANKAGTATVSASIDGVSASVLLRVPAARLMSISITPPAANIPAGLTAAFAAMGVYSDGTTGDISASATWSSSAPAIASVDGSGLTTGVTVGRATITATLGGLSGAASVTVTNASLVSIGVTPAALTIPAGRSQAFTAIATYSDLSTRDVTSSVSWTSSDATVVSINAAGVARGLAPGTITVTATDAASGVAGGAGVTVTNAVLTALAVTPASASIFTSSTQTFAAIGTYSDGSTNDITSAVTWSSTVSAVATISNAAVSPGVATGLTAGSTVITASDSATGIQAKAQLTVKTAVLLSIAVTPATATIPAGTTQAFAATGTYSDGSSLDITTSVSWSATAAASIASTGVATGVTSGTAIIKAVDAATGVSGTATLTVSPAKLVSLAVSGPTGALPIGSKASCKAVGTFSDSSTKDLTNSVTWSSATPSVASVSNAAGSNGRVTALAVGSTTVTATDPATGINAAVGIVTTDAALLSITVTPTTVTLPSGSNQSFTATGKYTDGTSADISASVSWNSSSSAITNLDATGHAHAGALGSATITALDVGSGIRGTATMSVTAPVVVGITITETASSVATKSTENLLAFAVYSDGTTKNITSTASWSSSDTTVATIVAGGVATGVAPGAATISASDPGSGLTGTAILDVSATFVAETVVTGSAVGAAIALDSSDTPFITWTENPNDPPYDTWQVNWMRRAGGATPWVNDGFDSGGGYAFGASQVVSMATDGTGAPCVALARPSDFALVEYCRAAANDWRSTAVTSKAIAGGPVSMAFDTVANPRFLFTDSAGYVAYAHDGTIDEVDLSSDNGVSLAFSSKGPAHIAYSSNGGGVKHAINSGSGWMIDTVDSTANGGYCVATAVDAAGTPYVLYGNGTTATVSLATGGGGSWTISSVGMASASYPCSLIIDRRGTKHAIFGDTYAVQFPGRPWLSSTLASGGLFGAIQYGLAVDSTGKPHLVGWGLGTVSYLHE